MVRSALVRFVVVLTLAACGGGTEFGVDVPDDPADVAEGKADAAAYSVRLKSTYQPAVQLNSKLPASLTAGTFRIGIFDKTDGAQVTDFEIAHEKPMHMIAVSYDFQDFEHVHPELDDQGYLWVDKVFYRPTKYRFFFEYQPSQATEQVSRRTVGPQGSTTTGPSLLKGQTFDGTQTVDLTAPSQNWGVAVDRVSASQAVKAGESTKVRLTATKTNGDPKEDLTHYLGMPGHAIVLSENARTFRHYHGEIATMGHGGHGQGGDLGTNEVTFDLLFPTAGSYRVWFQLRDTQVRTFMVDFKVAAQSGGGSPTPAPAPTPSPTPHH